MDNEATVTTDLESVDDYSEYIIINKDTTINEIYEEMSLGKSTAIVTFNNIVYTTELYISPDNNFIISLKEQVECQQ